MTVPNFDILDKTLEYTSQPLKDQKSYKTDVSPVTLKPLSSLLWQSNI